MKEEVITTKVIAHRGASAFWPQNTLIAYEKAIEVHSDGIEIDVHLSKDGELIVMHDPEVAGTTDGSGMIRDLTLGEIKKLNAAAKFMAKNLHEEVPTLEEVFDLLTMNHYIGILNIEIKTDSFEYVGVEQKIIDLIHKMTLSFDIIFSSFNLESLKRISEIDTSSKCAYLYESEKEKAEIVEKSDFLEGHHPDYSFLKTETSQKTTKNVRVWTVNDGDEIRECFNRKVDSVITDDPALALKIRSELKKS